MSSAVPSRAPAPGRGTVAAWSDPGVRFAVLGAVAFALLYWLFRIDGPVPAFGAFVRWMTEVQASMAARFLNLIGQPVERNGLTLMGGGFACEVGEGCNGFAALTLALAGVLAWPVSPLRRLSGLLWIVPAVLSLNVLRIAGLWWVGRHHSALFDMAHVYVGQVIVIVGTVAAWGIWLSWNKPHPNASR